MIKLVEFDVVNNCNRDITIKIGNGSMSVRKGEKKKFNKEEGLAVEVYPHNASFTKQVGTVNGSTIVVSGYDK